MAKRKRIVPGKKLAKKLFSNKDIFREPYHGRVSAWDFLAKREEKKFEDFAYHYFVSLHKKHVRDRAAFIEKQLKRYKYRSIEEISGETIEMALQTDSSSRLRAGQKFYVKLHDTMILAVQLGRHDLEFGTNIAAAHIDSPGVVGRIKKLKQDYNLAYMLATTKGGVMPKDFFNQPMSLFFHGVVKDRRGKEVIIDFSSGEQEGPPVYFAEQSYHLSEGEDPKTVQLEAIVGNIPYPDKRFDPSKRIILNVLQGLNKKYRLTEYDLEDGEIWFLPSQDPTWVGLDSSMIAGYGQDNWASAFPLLQGFLNVKQPAYTKIALFYDKEEIGDTGRGSLGTDFFENVVMPALASLARKDLGDHYKMLRNSWSLFCDVTEPIHSYKPESYDVLDSSYISSGVVITSYLSGDGEGYESSPEFIRAIRKLLNENKVNNDLATMGNQEENVSNSSARFHQTLLSQGIDLGIPCIGLHRTNELVSTIDLWNLTKAIQAFYSVEDHDDYMPKKKS